MKSGSWTLPKKIFFYILKVSNECKFIESQIKPQTLHFHCNLDLNEFSLATVHE